ncbi:MAG: SGNH/GDSL hydrolase family protein [Anaerolineae bacterium]|nr:SGNH/GDSL hydrolase family protein [Anaerolineae bacterium]
MTRAAAILVMLILLAGTPPLGAHGSLNASPLPDCCSSAPSSLGTGVWLIGDSLSRGSLATSEEKTYHSMMEKAFGFPITRIRGCTVAAALREVEKVSRWPAVAFIEVGINDLRDTPAPNQVLCPWIPAAEFGETYRKLVDILESRQTLVIAGTIPWSSWVESHPAWLKIALFNEAIAQSGANVADLWTATLFIPDQLSRPEDSSFLPPYRGDNFHPGDVGHARIAKTFLNAYRRALGQRTFFIPLIEGVRAR